MSSRQAIAAGTLAGAAAEPAAGAAAAVSETGLTVGMGVLVGKVC
jgi:hypothetical protein